MSNFNIKFEKIDSIPNFINSKKEQTLFILIDSLQKVLKDLHNIRNESDYEKINSKFNPFKDEYIVLNNFSSKLTKKINEFVLSCNMEESTIIAAFGLIDKLLNKDENLLFISSLEK